MNRDWAASAELKSRHWADVRAREGAAGILRAAEAASRTLRALRPDWPTEADRERDFAEHLRLCKMFEDADRRLRG